MPIDPIALARAQLAHDRTIDRTAKGIFAAKCERMCASAFSFLRGSAPLFFRILREQPALARGPAGRGWLTGDLHVQNLGAYRTDDRNGKACVVFGPNDFDEACIGPVRFDLLRLTTSWLLALDERPIASACRVESCRAIVDGWTRGAFGARSVRKPAPIRRLVLKVASRTKEALHAGYVAGSPRALRLQRHARLWPVSPVLARRVRTAFDGYAAHASVVFGESADHFEVLDVARRIAGTGSLGVERFAVLTRGGARGEWLFDVKEEEAKASSGLPAAGLTGAARVMRGIGLGAPAPPRMLGNARLGNISMLVRRLSPQEDKLDPARLETSELDDVALYVGWLAGRMHRRTAVGSLGRAWPEAERRAVVERAITLAGIHESAHLAYVALVR